MKLVEFASPEGKPVWVNPALVVVLDGVSDSAVRLHFSPTWNIVVKGNLEETQYAIFRGLNYT